MEISRGQANAHEGCANCLAKSECGWEMEKEIITNEAFFTKLKEVRLEYRSKDNA